MCPLKLRAATGMPKHLIWRNVVKNKQWIDKAEPGTGSIIELCYLWEARVTYGCLRTALKEHVTFVLFCSRYCQQPLNGIDVSLSLMTNMSLQPALYALFHLTVILCAASVSE
jgi:hypothetical protein